MMIYVHLHVRFDSFTTWLVPRSHCSHEGDSSSSRLGGHRRRPVGSGAGAGVRRTIHVSHLARHLRMSGLLHL